MSTGTRKVATVAGLIAGGAVLGAGLGILFAPQAGADSRRALRGYAQRAQDGASRFGQQVKTRVSHAIRVSRSFMKDGEEKAP